MASIVGCLITRMLGRDPGAFPAQFLMLWSAVIVVAVGTDYLLMKRRAARVGKHVISRLGKQMVIASAPGLEPASC